MIGRTNTGMPVGQLTGIRFGVGDEFLQIMRWYGWMHRDADKIRRDTANRV
jgi:hypothetical protein